MKAALLALALLLAGALILTDRTGTCGSDSDCEGIYGDVDGYAAGVSQ